MFLTAFKKWKLIHIHYQWPFSLLSMPLGHMYNEVPIVKFLAYLVSHVYMLLLMIVTTVTPLSPIWENTSLMPNWYVWAICVLGFIFMCCCFCLYFVVFCLCCCWFGYEDSQSLGGLCAMGVEWKLICYFSTEQSGNR